MKTSLSAIFKNKRAVTNAVLVAITLGILVIGGFVIHYDWELDQLCHSFSVAFWLLAMASVLIVTNLPKGKPENIFLIVGTLMGLCYMVAMVPLAVPDEGTHHMITLSQAATLVKGGWNVDAAYLDYTAFTLHNNSYEAFEYMYGYKALFEETLTGEIVAFEGYTSNYPLQYFPQTIGASIALLLGLNRYWLFLLGDLFNLAFYVGVTYVAIRRIPVGKTVMLLIATLPMALHQASSLSSDPFLNALSYLFIAEAVRAIMGEGQMTWKDMLILVLPGFLMTPAKAVYGALMLAVAFIPGKRFSSRKVRWTFVIGTILLAMVAAVLPYLDWFLDRFGVTITGEASTQSYGYSLTWVFQHPAETANIIGMTLLENTFDTYLDTMVGYALSGMSLYVNHGYVNMFVIIFALAAIVGAPGEQKLDGGRRAAFITIAAIALLGVVMSMFIGWTNPGETRVGGVQGRYFLPIVPLLLIGLRSHHIEPKKDMSRFYASAYAILNAFVLQDVLDYIMLM